MGLPYKERLLFTKNLAVMLKSGIPIGEAIATIKDQTSNGRMKKILSKVEADVINGNQLSKSLSNFNDVFDPFYVNLVAIGEKSGNLENNLAYLAEGLKKDYEFRQKVAGASIYPAIVILTAIIVGAGVAYFVLPKLIDIITPLDIELPLSTKILIWISTLMRDSGLEILLGLVAVFISMSILYLIKPVRLVWQKILTTLPIYGDFYVNVQMTYLCRNLGIMLRSGLPIFEALESQTKATSNLVFRNYVASLSKSVASGISLSEAMIKKNSRMVPRMAVKMISVGDKSGKLDESLLYMSEYFEEEVDNSAKTFANIVEPAMLLVVGGMVAFLAFSIISPIYKFTGSIGP